MHPSRQVAANRKGRKSKKGRIFTQKDAFLKEMYARQNIFEVANPAVLASGP